ncbi:DNA alkylation repair protein [bacterium]|nr:DNA alkylation repair protein [bacterium]MCI0605520.1 DNA alkylation repair protein [bacterium]
MLNRSPQRSRREKKSLSLRPLRSSVQKKLDEIKRKLRELANPERAKVSLRYFKTGPGGYGAGDLFLGNTVPDLRKLAGQYRDLNKKDILELLHSPIHEERVLALLILNLQFKSGAEPKRKEIHRLYLNNMKSINSWDLVDCSAPLLIGGYLLKKDTKILDKLAASNNLWERRTAIIATLAFIKQNEYGVTLRIATRLLKDKEDLIHKGSGWMLREVGNRAPEVLEAFLDKHAAIMPRTMLRYAIEKFNEPKRKAYLLKR